MAVTLTTSAGEIFRPANRGQLSRALARLAPARAVGPPLVAERRIESIYLADDAGNELTLTARGILRLYFADTPDYNLSLNLGPEGVASSARQWCAEFLAGNMEWVRGEPWVRNRNTDERDFPVAAPLPGAETTPEAEPSAAPYSPQMPESMESEPAPELLSGEALRHEAAPCPRCGVAMTVGYLTTRVGRMHALVRWGTGGIRHIGWTPYIEKPDQLQPVIALRCPTCGHVEFRA